MKYKSQLSQTNRMTLRVTVNVLRTRLDAQRDELATAN